jgi:MFS family permease
MLMEQPAGTGTTYEAIHTAGAEAAGAEHVASSIESTDGGDSEESTSPGSLGSTPARKSSFLAPLRIANMRRLLAGQSISRFGDQFYFVALPWLVLRASDSPIALSLVIGTAAAALGVFTLLGGVLADRFGARRLMLTADVFRLLIVSGLAAAVLVGTLPLWSLVVLSGLLGAGGGLFYPASAAMIPHLVAPDNLQAANGFDQLTMQTSNFVGPSVAGVVLATTRLAFGFVIDALTFAVSVVSLVAIRMPRRRPQLATPAATAALQEGQPVRKGGMGEAIHFLRASPFLLTLLGVSLIANFAIGGLPEVALPLLLKQWVGLTEGPRALGIVIGGFGLGSVIGAIIASVATRIPHKPLVGIVTVLPTGAMLGAAPYLGGVYTLAAIFGVVGLLLAISNVLFATVLQRFIPLEMMGRVMSISMLGSFLGTPLSIFAYGAIATVVPDVAYLFVAGGALLVFACLFSLGRKVIWQTM